MNKLIRKRKRPTRTMLVFGTVVLSFVTLSLAMLQSSDTATDDQAQSHAVDNGLNAAAEIHSDPLPDGAFLRLGTTRLRHRNEVKLTRFSPNGKILASAGSDTSIRLWDVETGKQIRELGGFGRWKIYGLVFSPDGKKLASVHQKGIVRLWNTATGKLLCKPQTHPGAAREKYAIAFAPDGKNLATVGGIQVRLWSADDLNPLKQFPTRLPRGTRGKPAVAFSPDGKLLAANGDGDIYLWNLAADQPAERIELPHVNGTTSLVFTPDSSTLITGGQGTLRSIQIGNRGGSTMAEIKLWDTQTRQQTGSLATQSFDSGLYSLALSHDGTRLASGHHREARIWNLNDNSLHSIIQEDYSVFGGYPSNLDISHDGKKLASRINGNTVGIWDVESGNLIAGNAETHQRSVNTIGIANGGKTIITGANGGSIHFWESATGKHVGHFSSSGQSASIAASPNGKSLAIGGGIRILRDGVTVYSGTIQIMDLERLEKGPKLNFTDVIGPMTYSQDSRIIAAATYNDPHRKPGELNEAILVIDVKTGKTLNRLGIHDSVVAGIAISPDRKTLYSVHRNATLQHWDLAEGKRFQTTKIAVEKRKYLSHVAFSADGKRVVTCETFGAAFVITDLTSGKQIRTINVPNTLGNLLAISPDGRYLASACQPITSTKATFDEKIHLWEIDTGKELMAFDASSDGTVASLVFLPDGKTLVSGMNRGTALLWDVSGEK